MTTRSSPAESAPTAFAATHWTLVQRARGATPEARAALAELCAHYHQPVFRFLRREGREADAALELTQEFFARVLAGRGFAGADPQRGRFRSFLLGAVKHFLADVRTRAQRQKRGGGASPESLEAPLGATDTAPGLQVPDPAGLPSDAWFDRAWALTVMDRALTALEAEYARTSRSAQFAALKPWLATNPTEPHPNTTAPDLGLSDGALKVAIHRLRKRFATLVRAEIAKTVAEPDAIQEELRYLVAALACTVP